MEMSERNQSDVTTWLQGVLLKIFLTPDKFSSFPFIVPWALTRNCPEMSMSIYYEGNMQVFGGERNFLKFLIFIAHRKYMDEMEYIF